MNRILSIAVLIISIQGWSQFGNEWIDYSQQYYSFKIYQDGIYKLDYATLNAAGVPVASIAPDDYQVFGFEREQQILVEDGSDGSFDPGDYILFYAKKNTTWLDSMMYDEPEYVANRYYPHYNDTICYYLSWNVGASNERMNIESDVDFASYTAKPYFLKTDFKEGHNWYLEGYKLNGMSNTTYVSGEGWGANPIQGGTVADKQDDIYNTTNAYTGAGAPSAIGLAVSASANNASPEGDYNHHLQLQYGPSNIVLYDTAYYGYQKINLPFSIPASQLGGSTTRIRHQVVFDLGVASDYQSVVFTELTFAHTPDLENESEYWMTVPYNSSEAKALYQFTNFNSANPMAFTLNSGHLKSLPVVESAGTYSVLVPNLASGDNQKVLMIDESEFIDVTDVEAVNGSGTFTDYPSLNYESAYLLISHPDLWVGAQDYRDYRSSIAGGSHNVHLVNVEELYHQFGGGVPKHVMGVRRFAHMAYEAASNKPDNLFILGKGVREANEILATGNGTRQNPASYQMCKIPSLGYPASDHLITSRLSGNQWEPLIPTGRVAAQTEEEVQLYLSKIQEYEEQQVDTDPYTIDSKYWQKDILHFAGGGTTIEQETFQYYLNNYENVLEGPEYGGNVTTFKKTVSDPIDPVTLYEVTEIINDGVSLMTFFGHAAVDGFDQNIEEPENWDNQGKYPIVVGNACLTGDIHAPNQNSTSEKFVIVPDKGAIAFLANVNQAFSTSLNTFSTALFNDVSVDNYGQSFGYNIQNTVKNVQSDEMSFGLRNVCLQMTLHGDPALKMNSHPFPELEVNETSIFTTPEIVDLSVDSIDVNVVIYNMGKSATDTFAVELTRIFPNNNGDSLYTRYVYGIDYLDTVVFTIPFYANIGVGINEFKVAVDIPSVVDETWDEINNNQISKKILFDVDGIYPVWPYNFAVVPSDTIVLKGSTVNPFAEMATYRFEIDTTDLFASPRHLYATVTSTGGVIEVNYDDWYRVASNIKDDLILEDSMVYFWRATVVDTGEYYWNESSFQYIEGKQGWGQDHFFQFKDNDRLFVGYDRTQRKRLFQSPFALIEGQVWGNAATVFEHANTWFKVNGEIAEYNYCTTIPQIMVCVIDPFDFGVWGTRFTDATGTQNPDHVFGNWNDESGCRARVEYHFPFVPGVDWSMDSCVTMINDKIPNGYYYLIYSTRYAPWSLIDMNPEFYTACQNLGSDSLFAGRTENVPFMLFGRKGDTTTCVDIMGQDIDEIIHFEDTLWGNDYFGIESSPVIGPAVEWQELHWNQDAEETPTNDDTELQLYGIGASGYKTLLMDTVFSPHDSIIDISGIIDADVYPYMQLSSVLKDTIHFTPAQVDFWHVLYEIPPEAALDGTEGVHFIPGDTLSEGQLIEVAFDINNISDKDMDSLLVNYWMEDADHNLIPISYPRQDSLRSGESFRDTLTIPSKGLFDLTSLWVEVNPYVTPYFKDQPEQYHFNNVGQIPFHVNQDEENPILDVTFNGYHILSGDIVDPQSQIIISLKDENEFLIMNEEADTANFGLYITHPDGYLERLNFRNALGEPLMEWVPADGSSKKFKIIYDGDFEEDGVYRLLVQGADESGNISGDFDYDIEFEVIHESTITHLMNYPNPFSTSTQFVFTLTGSQIPDEFTIQILTVTGKVVREITVDELGPINIGRNITDFRWDGRDEYGDQLANGVYLYRVITKINGEELEHRETKADEYFKKGFGKMYLMR